MELAVRNNIVNNIQLAILENNDLPGIYGDGKGIVEVPEIPITHKFADQIYFRQMNMPAGSMVVGAIHNHLHGWALLTGRIIVIDGESEIEYVAPYYAISEPGTKRFILALEDSIFLNIHKNPTNTQNTDEIENEIFSITEEEYNQKNKEYGWYNNGNGSWDSNKSRWDNSCIFHGGIRSKCGCCKRSTKKFRNKCIRK